MRMNPICKLKSAKQNLNRNTKKSCSVRFMTPALMN